MIIICPCVWETPTCRASVMLWTGSPSQTGWTKRFCTTRTFPSWNTYPSSLWHSTSCLPTHTFPASPIHTASMRWCCLQLHALTGVLYIIKINNWDELNSLLQASSRLLSCKNALCTMLSDIPACIRTRTSQLILTLDMLPLLLDIICPKLRPVCESVYSIPAYVVECRNWTPEVLVHNKKYMGGQFSLQKLMDCSWSSALWLFQVNPQLFSSREKEQMRELIDSMLAYNLSYRQDRTPEGQYMYILEPWVHAHTWAKTHSCTDF